MATTYVPVPTATQAPAAQPDPDNFPALTLPAAGDGDTAASVAQAFKVLGDYIAWLKAPRSAASAWAQRLRTYLNARQQRRHFIDHLGFPGGNVQGWDERWDKTLAGTFGANLAWVSTPGSGTIGIVPAGFLIGLCRLVGFTTSTSVTGLPGCTYAQRATGCCVPSADLAVTFDTVIWLTAVATNNTLVTVGLVSASSTSQAGGVGFGAWFSKAETQANWQACVDSVTPVDLGVGPSAGVAQRLRIEYMGTGTSDDSTARSLFYVDDVLKANIAHAITPGGSGDELVPLIGCARTTTGGAAVTLYVGPTRYRQNTFQTV